MTNTASERNFINNPVLRLFASQLLAAIVVFALIAPALNPSMPVLLGILAFIAAVAGRIFGLSPWWIWVQVALPFAAYYSRDLHLPAWIWLALFVLVFLVYKNSIRSGVPLYLSNRTTWTAMADMIGPEKGVKVVDLGGGIGGASLYMARQRPNAEFLSIESAPIPAFLSRLRGKLSGLDNIDMRYGDFWGEDLGPFQVVYAFLSPVPMERLYQKVQAEMKPGSLFVSNSFDVPGVTPDDILELDDQRKTRLLIWRL